MTPVELKNLFRSDVRDEATPPLWSDVEIYAYMSDAQQMFCRLGGGIADAASPMCSVPVSIGDVWVPYDRKILKLRSVTLNSSMRDVPILNAEDLDRPLYGQNDYGEPYTARFSNTPGPIRSVVSGMQANQLRLTCPAQEADTLLFLIYRLPLENITAANAAAVELEIDEQHHLHLMDGMKRLAYRKQDAETYDKGKADYFDAAFFAYCDQAKAERERREHKGRAVVFNNFG